MICAPIALCSQKIRSLAKRETAGENKPEVSRVTRDKLEPNALHSVAHRDQRQHQFDPAEQSDSAKIIAKKFRRFFQFGHHFDECGHGTLVLLLFLAKPARTANSDLILPAWWFCFMSWFTLRNQRSSEDDRRLRQSASIMVAMVLTVIGFTVAMFQV
jgi:hypothetical protein